MQCPEQVVPAGGNDLQSQRILGQWLEPAAQGQIE
jgi:hypothetical protein